MSEHRARYKNTGLDAKELRRRREEDSVQLRKQKRDDVLSKRRTIGPPDQDDDFAKLTNDTEDNLSAGKFEAVDREQHIPVKELVEGLMQDEDLQLLTDNAQKIRKILSKEPEPPIDEVINSGVMPRLAQLLERDDCHILQYEVAWVLTNVASGTTEQTRTLVDTGATKTFIRLLASPHPEVREQALWALGNIIGDGAGFRDMVINLGFVPALLALIRPDMDVSFLRNATWVLVNLCRNKDPPTSAEVITQLLPALNFLIQSTDLPILIDTTWAISYITELGSSYSQLVIDSGLVYKITPLLTNPEIKVQTAAIRALGSIVTGSEEQTQAVLEAGALPHLNKLLIDGNPRVIKEVLWFISNITAGSISQVQAILDNQLIPSIIHHLTKGDLSQKKEALWTVFNMCLSGTPKHLQILYESGVIAPLCDLLKLSDNMVIRNALESIRCLLTACRQTNPEICEVIEECGGLDQIESLQQHKNPEIYGFAFGIIEQFFQGEDYQES